MLGPTARRSSPVSACRVSSASSRMRSASVTVLTASATTRRPTAVGSTRLFVRSKSRRPSSSSRLATILLSVGCVMPQWSAARAKLRNLSTAMM